MEGTGIEPADDCRGMQASDGGDGGALFSDASLEQATDLRVRGRRSLQHIMEDPFKGRGFEEASALGCRGSGHTAGEEQREL
jgi:hypothetical protein